MGKILIVDDDMHTNAMLAEALKLHKFEVVQAYSGEEALEVLQFHQINLILLDMLLPGIKGWDVAERLQKNPQTAKIAIVVISIVGPEDVLIEKKSSSIAAYVCKPFDIEVMIQEVKKIINPN